MGSVWKEYGKQWRIGMQKHKERLDLRMVERGLAPSREKAKAMIMAGHVYVNEQREDKAGMLVEEEAEILVRGPVLPYVSRGGLKLEKAIKAFGVPLEGCICMTRAPPLAVHRLYAAERSREGIRDRRRLRTAGMEVAAG